MAGCLIFLFASGVDFALDQATLTGSPINHFRLGFNLLRVMANTSALSFVPTMEVPMGYELIL